MIILPAPKERRERRPHSCGIRSASGDDPEGSLSPLMIGQWARKPHGGPGAV
jgi:hypothetical protein